MDVAGARIRTMDALCRNASGRYVLRHRVHDCRGESRAIKALSFDSAFFRARAPHRLLRSHTERPLKPSGPFERTETACAHWY